jgi:catechol 2,3-dioxygenase-like lactoylglutathione lyase family enzyme
MSATKRLGRIHLITVPSTDQDRSIAFYESIGFEKRADAPFGDGRWVEVFPPDGKAGVALVPASDGSTGIDTSLIVTSDDVDATHAELQAAGFDVDPEVARPGSPAKVRIGAVELTGPDPAMFYLRDPDGNALLVIGSG